MNNVHIKVMSDEAIEYLKKNIEHVTTKIQENDDNSWIYEDFPQPMFITKKYEINDFDLLDNPNSDDKEKDYINSIRLYENLNMLPRYILSNQNFWLWLHFEKFYLITKRMMKVNGTSTIKDHWMHGQGVRRGLFFGVLSRCFFRVYLTVDEAKEDKYTLSKWVIENPLRFRNLSWRTYSSEKHLVRGILTGEKKAIEEKGYEKNDYYVEIAKYVSNIGSVRLLDVISENDIKDMIYKKMLEIME